MRKQDLKVGEEYAVGGVRLRDRWHMSRVVVESLDGEALNRYNRPAKGIVLRFPGGSTGYPFYGVKPGDSRVINSARDIQMPWAEYAERKAAFDARQDASRREADRARAVADDAEERMRALDLPYTRSGSDFRFTAGAMAAIVAMIPDGR